MLIAIIAIPLLCAFASWFIPADTPRRALLVGASFTVFCLAVSTWCVDPAPAAKGFLALDAAGRIVLTITATLFLAASLYAIAYLRAEDSGERKDFLQGLHFSNAPEATFTACLLLFLTAAALVALTQHFGLLWVGIETTTIVSAPLIYFHRHQRSLEATWKYLMICSVGIALALIGNLLLDVSFQTEGHTSLEMTVSGFSALTDKIHPGWFKAGFVFLLIGYGTKMGIAPMHTWLPDAHSEAPSLVSALLSGALLNCAFLGIFRAYQVSSAAGLQEFTGPLLTAFGLFSMLISAFFVINQTDFKRLLAYSSVEHMGILLLGLGIGGSGIRASFLHMAGHSFVKAALFLLAGNILAKYRTKMISDVSGMMRILPSTSLLWLTGILAITGSPPFSVFISEFSMLHALLQHGHMWKAAAYLTLLAAIFVGMLTPAVRMFKGAPPVGLDATEKEDPLLFVPSACLLFFALVTGLYMPGWFDATLSATVTLGTGK